ncbi:unnamed protein product, partial [marine sediment metagenome]
MKRYNFKKVMIAAVIVFFVMTSLSPAQIISEQNKAGEIIDQNTVNNVLKLLQSNRYNPCKHLFFIESGPILESTLYADGSIVELQTETVTWPVMGPDSPDMTLEEFKKMVQSARETFENDPNRIIIDKDGP